MRLMLKCLFSMFVLFICAAGVMADELPPYVNADWGASPDNVVFWENDPIYREKSELKPWQTQYVAYERTMFGKPFMLNYSFDGEKLCAADYFLSDNSARQLTIAEAKALIAQIDTNILPRLGTPRTAVVEKSAPEDKDADLAGSFWRYGKIAANERTCILVFAVIDEARGAAQFSISFAAAEHGSAHELKEAFDRLKDDSAWMAAGR